MPSYRQVGVGTAVLLDQAARPGWWGGLADFGSIVFGELSRGAAARTKPVLVLLHSVSRGRTPSRLHSCNRLSLVLQASGSCQSLSPVRKCCSRWVLQRCMRLPLCGQQLSWAKGVATW